MNLANVSKQIINLLFKKGPLNTNDLNYLNSLFNIISEADTKTIQIPYALIIRKINRLNKKKLTTIISNVQINLNCINKGSKNANRFSKELLANIKAAVTQRHYHNESIKSINNKIDYIKKTFSSKVKRDLYINIIEILGVFTAVTFATFGGLQLLGNVFGKVKKYNASNVGYELILGSAFLLGTYAILITLINFLLEITNHKIVSISSRISKISLMSFIILFIIGCIFQIF